MAPVTLPRPPTTVTMRANTVMESPDVGVHRNHRPGHRHQRSQDPAQDEDEAKHLFGSMPISRGPLLVLDHRSDRPPQGGPSKEDEETRKGDERNPRGHQGFPGAWAPRGSPRLHPRCAGEALGDSAS